MAGMRVTLGQLKAFETVARLGSFSAAGKALSVTQPAISKKLRQLQDEVGLPLFEQVDRRLYLTDAGRLLLAVCNDWLETWARFEQSIADLQGLKQGRLRIAVVTTSKYFIPRVLGPFCELYPGIDVAMEVVNRDRLLERLARNEDDLYIMGLPPEDIDSEPLVINPLVVIAPIGHALDGRGAIRFAELADQCFLVRERGSGTRIAVERIFREQGIPLQVKMELGSNEAIKQAVAGGLGLAVMSRHALNSLTGSEGLVELAVEGFPIERHWYVVTPRGKRLSVVAETFLAFLRAHRQMLMPG
jgi:LysR family transcriptional regulator, low CO2-responsive transcriptional regulator